MSALLEFNPRIGSTLPRIYTPTLPQHADPEAEYGIKPDATWGPLCCQFLEELLGWELLPWQKWLYHHALEKRPDNTGFRFRLLLVLVGRQQGKALDIETPILTRTGWKQMGDVEVGDEVFHPDGHHTRVIGAFDPMFEHRCYEVITTDGRKVVADADHLWTVQDRRRKFRKGRRGEKPVQTYAWETLTTTELIERGVTGARPKDFSYRLPAQQQIISKPVELPINPYVLGIWLGDGASNASIIHVGDQDVEELKVHLTVAGAEVINAKRYRTCWNISFGGTGAGTRNAFKAAAQQLGVWGNKHIPDLYLTAGTEQRAALLAGLLDTDGHCAATDGQVEFCSTKEELADGVLYLARSLGYRATKTAGRATLAARDCGPKYRVRFTPSTAPFRLARKNARVRPIVGDRTAISIRSITEVGSRPVRCIKVDRPDGLFLAGRDLMPTHNTTWGRGLGLWRLFMDQQGRPDPLWPAAKLAVVAAQNLEYAEQTLKEVVDCIRDHPLLAPELINHAVCLDVDTDLLTTAGWKTMGTIEVGDQVYHPDGHSTEVTEVHPVYTDHVCYRVITTDGRSLVCDADHLWTVQDTHRHSKERPWEILPTEQLIKRGLGNPPGRANRGRYRFRLPDQKAIISKPADLPIDPYLLGLWLGDGYKNQAELIIGQDEIEEISSYVSEVAEIVSVHPIKGAITLRFNIGERARDGFVARGRKLGIIGNKHIPESYLTAGTDQRLALLQGLMDSDGSINAKRGQVEFCSMRKVLADSVVYLCRSLGLRATLITGSVTLNGRDYGTRYRVCFTPDASQLNPFRLKRKAELVRTHPSRHASLKIKSIEPVPTRPVRCIKVARTDGLFLASKSLVPQHNTNGKHRAILTHRRLWRAATASRKGGRSLPVDFAWLDEIREHTTHDAFRAIEPTTTVRPCSQLLATSNAGDARSIVLRALRDSAMRNVTTGRTSETRTGFFEWSVPEDVDPRDPAYWHLALPAMGLLNDFCLEDVLGKFEAMEAGDMPGFQTEYLCQWIASLQPGIIPAQAWMDTLDRTSCIGEGEPVYACVDVNYHRTRAYVGLAGRRADGDIHIEVPPGEPRGVDWIADYLLTRKDHIAGVCIQRAGAPASSLTLDLRAAGIDIIDWGNPVTQLTDGAAAFFDGIVDGVIKHRPAPVLDRAAASTVAANAKDSWFFSRRNSPVDAAPLVACCGAAWLLNNPPPTIGPPTVWEWPDDDTLDEWRKETDERFS